MVEGESEEKVIETLKNVFLGAKAIYDKYHKSFIYFDKMKSPVKRINNKYRYQVLARIIDNYDIIEDEFYNLANSETSKKVLCYLEVNPSNIS
jgi:primosomal protein N'